MIDRSLDPPDPADLGGAPPCEICGAWEGGRCCQDEEDNEMPIDTHAIIEAAAQVAADNIRAIDYESIPQWVRDELDAWAQRGSIPGKFVRAVLENNLRDAFALGGENEVAAMRSIVAYCVWNIPAACWKTEANIVAWASAGGAEGLFRAADAAQEEESDGHRT